MEYRNIMDGQTELLYQYRASMCWRRGTRTPNVEERYQVTQCDFDPGLPPCLNPSSRLVTIYPTNNRPTTELHWYQ